MLYGCSVNVAKALPLERGLERIAAAGFTRIELIRGKGYIDSWRLDPARTRRLIESFGLEVVSIHPPQEGWDSDAPDPGVRRASIEAAAHDFAAGAELGAKVVVIHPNHSTHPFTREDYAASVARSIDSLGRLAELARAGGLRTAVENMPNFGEPRAAGNVTELLRMIDGMGSDVGICLDAGHAASNGLNAADEARIAGARIFSVHLQDTPEPGADTHLIPGRGLVDWPALIAALDAFAPDALRNFEIRAQVDELDSFLAEIAALARTWEARSAAKPRG